MQITRTVTITIDPDAFAAKMATTRAHALADLIARHDTLAQALTDAITRGVAGLLSNLDGILTVTVTEPPTPWCVLVPDDDDGVNLFDSEQAATAYRALRGPVETVLTTEPVLSLDEVRAMAAAGAGAGGLVCDTCFELLAGEPAVCQDGCPRDLDHPGTCGGVDDDQAPCAGCGLTGERLTTWAGDDAVTEVNPLYPHGRCLGCGWGQREDGSCPNNEDDCGRARLDVVLPSGMVLPPGTVLHVVQRQAPDGVLLFADPGQADAYAAEHDGAERSTTPVLDQASAAGLLTRSRASKVPLAHG